MAPSDFNRILIHGYPAALPDNHPLLTPSYQPCALCDIPTWRRCSKCAGPSYCSVQHETAHWSVHRRGCTGAPVEQRKAMIRPLKCYEVGTNEELPTVKALHFNPYKESGREVDIQYRPSGRRLGDQLVGPCPVLGKYFPNDVPQCVLLESDGDHTLDQPFAVWYSQRSINSGKTTNMAILALFDHDKQQPRRAWSGSVVVMKFASWSYHNFLPVTRNDIAYLKQYFYNYVGLEAV